MALWQDLRFTARTLRKSPGFAFVAILALGLGIGSTSAIFSIIDGVLLRPLPFPRPAQLMNVWETNAERHIPQMVAAPGNYYDWRAQNTVFSSIGAYQANTFNLAAAGNEPERFTGAITDPGFFAVLGVQPVLGRVFAAGEDEAGRDGVVVLGYRLWKQRFGGDRNLVGQNLNLNGRQRTVIGVMPDGFEYPPTAAMWSPMVLDGAAKARRDFHQFRVIARLKDGVSQEGARAEFAGISSRLDAAYPDLNKDEGIAVNSMLDDAVGPVRPALLVLLGAVAFVLLIACANVANLLLARAAGRRREIATRISMGATRGRLIAQMLTEGVLLALAGGAAGLLCAYAALQGLVTLAATNVPRWNQVELNWGVVAFTVGVSLATGVIFGLAPAWHATRVDLAGMLKEGSRGGGTRSRMRSVLVVAQVAAALILLAGAGLLMRSFYEIAHVDPGFQAEHLMSMRLQPAPIKYRGKPELQIELARGILRSVAGLPGVRSAAVSSDVPLLGNPLFIARFEGRPPVSPAQAPVLNYFAVTPAFFETMGMRMVRGRAFNDRDLPDGPLVAVINQALADRYFPNQDPVGKRLEIGFSEPPRWREIVGIVADVKTAGLDQATPVQVYTCFLQQPEFPAGVSRALTVLARTSQDPAAMGGAIKAAILGVDKAQPVYSVQPMTSIVQQSIAQRTLALILLAFFAATALFLASLGLYGVMSYTVTARTSEIGIRMALGAQQGRVLFEVQRQGVLLVLAGLAVGLPGAWLLTRLMTSLLFRTDTHDPLIFGVVSVTLLAVSLAASFVPARRASRVDPIVALRYE